MMKVKQEDSTLNMEIMKGKHEKLTTMVEELEENLQRERKEVEVPQMSFKEKKVTCVKNMEEAYKGIIQRKCEEVEGLRMRIEEKDTMDAVKAAADAAEAKGDAGHVNAVSDDIQKGQEISEAKEAKMSKTKSGKEFRISIAVEEKALQEGMQGGTAIRQ